MSHHRRAFTAAALATCLLSAGCGSSSDGEERATTITPAQSAAPGEPAGDGDVTLTEQQLQSALLTVGELPTGYRAAAPDEEDDDGGDAPPVGADAECSAKFEALRGDEDLESASAEASFEAGLGVLLEQSLESYEDQEELEKRFADVTSVLSDCPSFTDVDEDDGTKTELTIGALSFPKLGDETLALALTGKTPDFTVQLNIVIVRLGRNAMLISQGGLSTDAAALEAAARTGLTKLAAATEAA